MTRESIFQAETIRQLREEFPGAIILKNDPNYLQGFPDLLILSGYTWAALETKNSADARRQNNQEYYIDLLNSMAYASFMYPENRDEVFRELQQTFKFRRPARILRR
jgi:hypothetical protein